jgi:hypothetical protein
MQVIEFVLHNPCRQSVESEFDLLVFFIQSPNPDRDRTGDFDDYFRQAQASLRHFPCATLLQYLGVGQHQDVTFDFGHENPLRTANLRGGKSNVFPPPHVFEHAQHEPSLRFAHGQHGSGMSAQDRIRICDKLHISVRSAS